VQELARKRSEEKGRGGVDVVEYVKNHAFFDGFDWER